ncbi:hypothetical protein LZ30DRAFT_697365 [Colletotrichum cereale]|nr:hypothetical protein LZ30DRAFT_697365 [Colletotrichum cereale]
MFHALYVYERCHHWSYARHPRGGSLPPPLPTPKATERKEKIPSPVTGRSPAPTTHTVSPWNLPARRPFISQPHTAHQRSPNRCRHLSPALPRVPAQSEASIHPMGEVGIPGSSLPRVVCLHSTRRGVWGVAGMG